jgi:hypothetical protein
VIGFKVGMDVVRLDVESDGLGIILAVTGSYWQLLAVTGSYWQLLAVSGSY